MPRRSASIAAAFIAVALAACIASPPVKRLPRVNVPPGCLDDLSGQYVHALNPTYRYRAEDDGGTVVLAVTRVTLDGGVGRKLPSDPVIRVARTLRGFVGQTSARVWLEAAGKECPVDIPTAIVDCSDGGLTLQAPPRLSLDETCAMPDAGARVVASTQRLLRMGALAARPDGG